MTCQNIRQFIKLLQEHKQIAVIDAPVDANLEIAEIHRRVIAANGPALLFTNVIGKEFPVVTNMFGTQERIDLAFGPNPQALVREIAKLPEEFLPPSLGKAWEKRGLFKDFLNIGLRKTSQAPVLAERMTPCDLTRLPALTSWPEDGGPFLTLPLVHTEQIQHGANHQHGAKPSNLGMYRIQIFNQTQTGLHFQIGKGGGFHYYEAERSNQNLPLNIYLGGPPALILSAIAPLPENVPELMLASLVCGKKLDMAHPFAHPISPVAEAEFCITGHAKPHVRHPEGPFGDHYGYYSLQHDFPLLEVEAIYHRSKPIFPATVVGKPRQEDFYLGDYLQDLLSPLFPLVMPAVQDLWSYGETGYHSLSAAVLRNRYHREALGAAFRILGEGQLSLTKFLLCLDKPMDLKNFRKVLTYALERVRWEEDLYLIGHTSMDTLDYAGKSLNKGSKGILFGMGEAIRTLKNEWNEDYRDELIRRAKPFCPGCLVIEGKDYDSDSDLGKKLASHPRLAEWQLLVIVDDLTRALSSEQAFLWTTFTRFDPAQDMVSAKAEIIGNHIAYQGPMLIDARMKPWYPKELFCDPKTKQTVSQRWKEYFPHLKVEMGSSDYGHL